MSVLMIFLDGVGIGKNDPESNPFSKFPTPFFPAFTDSEKIKLPEDGLLISTDPTMGMPGIPQSATGQTALLTGVASAQIIGRHHPGFPTATLRKLLLEESIFLQLEKSGKKATFANAFTPEYFERRDRQISATTWAVKASGFPFRWLAPDLINGEAISHDLTNQFLRNLGYEAPERQPEEAAKILVSISKNVDFCLFEYFLTDMIGHSQDMARAKVELEKLNRFLETVLNEIDLTKNIVLLTSDHGNFEDLSIATHTLNHVPTSVWGINNHYFADKISEIQDVPQAIFSYIQNCS